MHSPVSLEPTPQPTLASSFTHIETWVFDLDNTLYPHHAKLWEQVDNRITIWIADYLDIDGLAARVLQKHYYERHGASLRGLMTDERFVPDMFLEFVHDIDHSPLEPNPQLGRAIAALPGRKLIFTSGSRKHAQAIAERLGVSDCFEDVFDIVAADFLPKPAKATYERFLARHGVEPKRAVMFEDLARNLVVPAEMGMTTVLVVPERSKEIVREAWELEGRLDPHIHHVTDDLAGFLSSLPETLR